MIAHVPVGGKQLDVVRVIAGGKEEKVTAEKGSNEGGSKKCAHW